MKYFAYGSNMSLARLRARAPGARRIGSYTLKAHSLRFHKVSMDGSGKCDAFYTNNPEDYIVGAVFDVDSFDKQALDKVEGLGIGYIEKSVIVHDESGNTVNAFTYYAMKIDATSKPYSWYKSHVLIGAKESSLPAYYIQKIDAIESAEDPDSDRDTQQRAIHQ